MTAGDLHMPRRTLDVIVPGMTASTSSSRRDTGKAAAGQGLSCSPGIPTTSGATVGGGPSTPKNNTNEPLDETFIDVRLYTAVECPML